MKPCTNSDTKEAALESSDWVSTNVLDRKKSPDVTDGIQKLLNAYK
jgi:hypothetical protein